MPVLRRADMPGLLTAPLHTNTVFSGVRASPAVGWGGGEGLVFTWERSNVANMFWEGGKLYCWRPSLEISISVTYLGWASRDIGLYWQVSMVHGTPLGVGPWNSWHHFVFRAKAHFCSKTLLWNSMKLNLLKILLSGIAGKCRIPISQPVQWHLCYSISYCSSVAVLMFKKKLFSRVMLTGVLCSIHQKGIGLNVLSSFMAGSCSWC